MSIISVKRPAWASNPDVQQQVTVIPNPLKSVPVPATLHSGEEVVPADVVRSVGGSVGVTQAMNSALQQRGMPPIDPRTDPGTVQPTRSVKGMACGTLGSRKPAFAGGTLGEIIKDSRNLTGTKTQGTNLPGTTDTSGVITDSGNTLGNKVGPKWPTGNQNTNDNAVQPVTPVTNPLPSARTAFSTPTKSVLGSTLAGRTNVGALLTGAPARTRTGADWSTQLGDNAIANLRTKSASPDSVNPGPTPPKNYPIPPETPTDVTQPGGLPKQSVSESIRNRSMEDLQRRQSATQMANAQQIAQAGYGQGSGGALTMQATLNAQQESAKADAEAYLTEAEQLRSEGKLQELAQVALDAGDFDGANKALTDLGLPSVDFSRAKALQSRGDYISMSNDLLTLADSITDPALKATITSSATKARMKAYDTIDSTVFDQASIDKALSDLSSGSPDGYTSPEATALAGHLSTAIVSWLDSDTGQLLRYDMASSPAAQAIVQRMGDGTATEQDYTDMGKAVTLAYNLDRGTLQPENLSDADKTLLAKFGDSRYSAVPKDTTTVDVTSLLSTPYSSDASDALANSDVPEEDKRRILNARIDVLAKGGEIDPNVMIDKPTFEALGKDSRIETIEANATQGFDPVVGKVYRVQIGTTKDKNGKQVIAYTYVMATGQGRNHEKGGGYKIIKDLVTGKTMNYVGPAGKNIGEWVRANLGWAQGEPWPVNDRGLAVPSRLTQS